MTEITITIKDEKSLSKVFDVIVGALNMQQDLPEAKHDPGFHSDNDMLEFARWCRVNHITELTPATIEKWHDHLADDFVQV